MQGLRQHVVALQTLWVVGSEDDSWFTTDYDEVDALPESQHIRQLCYVLRKDMVAPPSDPGDFTQDRPEQTLKLYRSLDRRMLASERRARALGLANFEQIGRVFFLGQSGALARMGIAPLEGPQGSVGERMVNGRRHVLGREIIGGCLPIQAMSTQLPLWGDVDVPVVAAPTGDLVLTVKAGSWAGGCIVSCVVTRPSLGWNYEMCNTRALGRQYQLALFLTENEDGKQFPINPTQAGTGYAQEYSGGHPNFPGTIKRIFWQVPPRPLDIKLYTDQHGSTVYEVLTIPVEFAPDFVEGGISGWPYDTTPITAGTEFGVVSAWTGLRFRMRMTFHYRGLPGVIRLDHFVENDFDLPAAGTAPGTGSFSVDHTVGFHTPRDIGGVNVEGYMFDAASEVRTVQHTLAPDFWPVDPPPATNRGWLLDTKTLTDRATPAITMPSPVPSGRGGFYGRSVGGAYAGLCIGQYHNFAHRGQVPSRSAISVQHLIAEVGLEGPRDAANTVGFGVSEFGHPENGLRSGAFGELVGLRAGVSHYTAFYLIGTQAEIEANMRQLYLLGH